MREYQYLTAEERQHFREHGWIRVRKAIKQKYIDEWMSDLWVRLGWDEHDKSTWTTEYLKMPRHREVPVEDFAPDAWNKMVELVGGYENINPVRERYFGDQFIINFGREDLVGKPDDPKDCEGWHADNDWFRMFLDSSNNALTIINLFTDVPKGGGGTYIAEDGIQGLCQVLYDNPRGLDPPEDRAAYKHLGNCSKYVQIEGEAGDVFITHGFLPHSHAPNHKHYARVITNPHVNCIVPYNLNRSDQDYTMCEQVILRALGRESIPEYKIQRERLAHYPRTAWFKRERIKDEIARMIAAAEAKGLGPESVDSVYLKGEEAIMEHEKRNGYDTAFGPNGVQTSNSSTGADYIPEVVRHVVGNVV